MKTKTPEIYSGYWETSKGLQAMNNMGRRFYKMNVQGELDMEKPLIQVWHKIPIQDHKNDNKWKRHYKENTDKRLGNWGGKWKERNKELQNSYFSHCVDYQSHAMLNTNFPLYLCK